MSYKGTFINDLNARVDNFLDLHGTVDELTYRSYAFNRREFPQTAPERWKTVFPAQEALERRFLAENRCSWWSAGMGEDAWQCSELATHEHEGMALCEKHYRNVVD